MRIGDASIYTMRELEALPKGTAGEPILGNWLRRSKLSLVCGQSSFGKSHLAMGVAIHTSAGVPFLGWKVAKPYRVLIIDGELGRDDFMEMRNNQWRLFTAAQRELVRDNLTVYAKQEQQDGSMWHNLDTPQGQAKVLTIIAHTDPDLIIIDNLLTVTKVENSFKDESFAPFFDRIEEFKRQGRAVLVMHHTSDKSSQKSYPIAAGCKGAGIIRIRPDNGALLWRPASWDKGEVHAQLDFGLKQARVGKPIQSKVIHLRRATGQWEWEPYGEGPGGSNTIAIDPEDALARELFEQQDEDGELYPSKLSFARELGVKSETANRMLLRAGVPQAEIDARWRRRPKPSAKL